nr:c-type cytochrome [Planctomycetota bacterium]
VERLIADPSAHVRRECAIALRFADAARAAPVWARLAQRHEAGDRWSLEALGIGAALNEDACFAALTEFVAGYLIAPNGRELIWRSRAAAALPYKGSLIADPGTTTPERLRLFRSLDFHRGQDEAKRAMLLTLLVGEQSDPIIAQEAAKRLGGQIDGVAAQSAIEAMLDASQDDQAFIQLVAQLGRTDRHPRVVDIAIAHGGDSIGASAVRSLVRTDVALLRATLGGETGRAQGLAGALGASGDGQSIALLQETVRDLDRPVEVRAAAVRALALSQEGARALLALGREGALGADLKAVASRAFTAIPWRELRNQAGDVFPAPAGMGGQLPPISELVAQAGDGTRGKIVHDGLCIACHVVGGQGMDFGPALNGIGLKLGKDALCEAILFPDAGIAHGFTTTELTLKDGAIVVGIVVSDTAANVSLKTAGGIVTPYAQADVAQRRELATSQMPTGLQAGMSRQDLVDLVEYLATLRAP